MKSKTERREIQNKLLELQEEVKSELMLLPNVVNVGVGLKETAGKLTDEIVFQVFVKDKVGENTLQTEQIIPKEIRGFKTDVIKISKARKRSDTSEHRPIKGGIQIGNGKGHVGTLGCFARLVADGTLVLLSNHHVLFSDGAVVGDIVGQSDIDSRCCCCCSYVNGQIGTILSPSDLDNDVVDCAIATIDSGITTDFILNNDMTSTELRIAGTEDVIIGDNVRKIGKTSGLTTGIVNSVTGVVPGKIDQIFVRPVDSETFTEATNGKKAFSDSGDSGSVIINEDNNIIGLLWGGDPDTYDVDETYACHISDVLDAFRNANREIEIELTPAGRSSASVKYFAKQQRLDLDLREKLLETAAGTKLVVLFETHQKEVLNLVNNNRNVTLIWHRHHGPAFTGYIAKSYRDPISSIPEHVKGITLQELLIKMATVLTENGSPTLKQAIERHAFGVISESYGFTNVTDFIEKMNNKVHVEFQD